MIETIRGKMRRVRTRLVMRSALTNGLLFRWSRRGIGARFNERASQWDRMVADHEHKWFDPLDAALDTLPDDWVPERVVDIGGGTGRAGYHLAKHYPVADVIVVDIAPNMLVTGKLRQRSETLPAVSFVAGDSASLPLQSEIADLVYVLNAPPNIAEMRRVLRHAGVAILAFTYGHHTPMYLDAQTSRRYLVSGGFVDFQHGTGGEGTWALARLPEE